MESSEATLHEALRIGCHSFQVWPAWLDLYGRIGLLQGVHEGL